jgi:hypothetical protein
MKLLARLEELLEKATPWPWQLDAIGDDILGKNGKSLLLTCGESPCFRIDEDAELIVTVVNALPKIIAAVRAAEMIDSEAWEAHDGTSDWMVVDTLMVALTEALADLNAKDTP